MGMIEIHPRTFTRSRGGTPTAERKFIETPDVTAKEPLPVLGEKHPEFAAMTCVSVTARSGYQGDPQQTEYSIRYEHVVT
jgi:hypothetical protein